LIKSKNRKIKWEKKNNDLLNWKIILINQ
jgi:hypothetical protein